MSIFETILMIMVLFGCAGAVIPNVYSLIQDYNQRLEKLEAINNYEETPTTLILRRLNIIEGQNTLLNEGIQALRDSTMMPPQD